MYNKNNPNYKLYLAGIITENQYYEMLEGKKKIFVLVGPPAVGKSTWIKNTFQKDDPYIINRDSIVEEVASQMEMTYDDMFSAPPKDATMGTEDEKYGTVVNSPSFMTWQPLSYSNILDANKVINDKLNDKIKNASTSGRDIVVDMTNMTANARKQALKSISGKEDMFHKVAVVFPFHGAEPARCLAGWVQRHHGRCGTAVRRGARARGDPPHSGAAGLLHRDAHHRRGLHAARPHRP